MQYVLLAFRDEEQWNAAPPAARDELEQACRESEHSLRQSGRLAASAGLQSGSAAVTVHAAGGKVVLAGGPYAGARGQLIRILFIHARDLNEAIQVAAQMPQARLGPVEVRPLLEPDRPAGPD